MKKTYIAIDLKSFYASVECVERGLDPLRTNLVVADVSRTEKTICLAVSPALKSWGIGGRPRLFEVEQRAEEINARRRGTAPGGVLQGGSWDSARLREHPELALEYIVAPPRMAHYIRHSARIYNIYLKYIAPEDIHVYSIDEVFLDVTGYLKSYKLTARQLAMRMILDVLNTTGITATAGIGPNLYLCKVAMDVYAKHIPPDRNGVRIARLDEMSYRRILWTHRPITDFWRVGRGYAKKLEKYGMYTMGDVARCSLGKPEEFHNEELLYRLFGVNAQLLIDHAWGWESCTIADIKAYRPRSSSVGAGQVLQQPYPAEKARLVVKEMAQALALELADKALAAGQVELTVGYDRESLSGEDDYRGEVTADYYGRPVPRHAHGSEHLERYTSSARYLVRAVLALYDRIVDPALLVRRLYLTAVRVVPEEQLPAQAPPEQLDLFADGEQRRAEERELDRDRRRQQAMLEIRRKYGRNAILQGTSLEEGATAMERNRQIGGHKA